MKNIIYFYLTVLLVSISCNKPEPEPKLPTGENTAYYYLDGQLVIPESYASGVTSINPINYYFCESPNNNFALVIEKSDIRLRINFINGINQLGQINLMNGVKTDVCDTNINAALLSIQNQTWYYFETNDNSGTINITSLSADKRKFTGSFQMDMYLNTGEVKHITNGHFNINLDAL